jgi:hypothetical protein
MTRGVRASASLVLVALVGAAAGCASAAPPVAVQVAQSPTAHFERYRTFAFETTREAPADFNATPEAAYVQARVEELAGGWLRRKGYSPEEAGARPDMIIRVSAGRRELWAEVHDPNAARYDRRGQTQEEEVLEGSFAIEAQDSVTRERLWRGLAVGAIRPGEPDEPQLEHAVDLTMGSFPGRHGAQP